MAYRRLHGNYAKVICADQIYRTCTSHLLYNDQHSTHLYGKASDCLAPVLPSETHNTLMG